MKLSGAACQHDQSARLRKIAGLPLRLHFTETATAWPEQ
jgi:hypothetical protein